MTQCLNAHNQKIRRIFSDHHKSDDQSYHKIIIKGKTGTAIGNPVPAVAENDLHELK